MNKQKKQSNEVNSPPSLPAATGGSTWTRWLPLVVVVVIGAYLASKAIPRSIPGPMDLSAAAKIAVVHEGRVQPIDSLARNELLIDSKKTTWRSDWLRPAQVKDYVELAKAIVEQSKSKPASVGGRIMTLATPEQRKTLEATAAATSVTRQMEMDLLMLLNEVIDDDARPSLQKHDEAHGHAHDERVRFYSPEDWKDVELSEDLKSGVTKVLEWDRRDPHDEKAKTPPLTGPQVIELNRMLLSTAFPKQLRAISAAQEPAIVWLMDVFADNRRSDSHRVFRVEHQRVLEVLGLPIRPGDYRYAIDEIRPRMMELDREANLALKTPSKMRDAYQAGIIDIANNLRRYMALQRFMRPHWIPPSALKGDWRNIEQIATESRATGIPNEDARNVMSILTAYSNGDVKLFNEAVKIHNDRLALGFAADVSRTNFETFFNRFDLFSHVTNLYLLVFLLVVTGWILFRYPAWAKALQRTAFFLLVMLVFVHTFGMFSRMYLMQRPLVFVTNLYASAVFIGLGGIIIALLIERVQKMGIGSACAATIGFITGIIALHLRGEGDTLEMQQAVLDTNLWLATHVTTVTLGYSTTYLAGALAIAFIIGGLFTKAFDAEARKSMGMVIYGVVCFSLFLSFVGTVLGGIWADQSWGRFWGWDPKENGALMIVIWNALILHARWAGMVQTRGIAVLAILGNIVTTWSWFGTNQLGAGLHSYGFMDKAVFWIVVFSASQLILAGIGMIPLSVWRSFSDDRGATSAKRSYTGPLATATVLLLVGGLAVWALLG